MADTKLTYSDVVIMRALLTKDFSLIGGAFEDADLTAIKKCAFQGAGATLTKVKLPSITQVPSGAFRGCSALTELTLPWSDLTFIGADAFRDARIPVSSITMPNVTTMADGAFSGCTGLTSITMAAVTAANGTDALYGTAQGGAFRDCTSLVSASFAVLRTCGQYFFRGCTALANVNMPSLAQISSNSFQNCTSLTKLKFPAAVTNIGGNAFNGATNLTAIILPNITAVPNSSNTTFTGSAVASGTCYIYVPQSLLATIKAANNWSTYSDMIRACEDYPEICA